MAFERKVWRSLQRPLLECSPWTLGVLNVRMWFNCTALSSYKDISIRPNNLCFKTTHLSVSGIIVRISLEVFYFLLSSIPNVLNFQAISKRPNFDYSLCYSCGYPVFLWQLVTKGPHFQFIWLSWGIFCSAPENLTHWGFDILVIPPSNSLKCIAQLYPSGSFFSIQVCSWLHCK